MYCFNSIWLVWSGMERVHVYISFYGFPRDGSHRLIDPWKKTRMGFASFTLAGSSIWMECRPFLQHELSQWLQVLDRFAQLWCLLASVEKLKLVPVIESFDKNSTISSRYVVWFVCIPMTLINDDNALTANLSSRPVMYILGVSWIIWQHTL